jgi:ABC-type microcin C transport system duplicated ATPase subunit YejF
MIANAILSLLPENVRVTAGDIRFEDRSLLTLGEQDMRKIRGARIGMIFQEPMTALNPLRTIGDQIGEMFRTHTNLDRATVRTRVLSLLSDVPIAHPEEIERAYPHELPGGQRQRDDRDGARARAGHSVADEPTTALDVTTQAQILALIRDLQARKGTSVLFITHDFGVVAEIADRVTVLQHGRVVEHGARDQLLNHPSESYTKELIAAVPSYLPPLSVQAQILRLLANLRKAFGLSMIFITHDLRVAAQICDRVAVMKDGEIVEHGATAKMFASPEHDYTRLLLRSIPGQRWVPQAAGVIPGGDRGVTSAAMVTRRWRGRRHAAASDRTLSPLNRAARATTRPPRVNQADCGSGRCRGQPTQTPSF